MWIVRLALRNPYTMGVVAAFLFLMGGLAIYFMKVDVLPEINIPVVNIVWQYTGLSPEDMENRVVFVAERGYVTGVNGVTKMTSRSVPGIGLIQVYFEQGTDIGAAISQITASSMSTLRTMPTGMQPPTIINYNASNVPVAQLTMSGDGVAEEDLFDYANNFVRLKLFTLPGLSTPAPYGGKFRQVIVDLQPELLAAKGLSAQDVVNALNVSNIIIPAGTARIGSIEYNVLMNSSPKEIAGFADIPIKTIGGQTVTIGQVAHVADSFADQTNIVRINGRRASFLNIIRKTQFSTIAVLNELKDAIGEIQKTAPPGMKFQIDFDQSTFVKEAVSSVITEAVIAAVLVSLMILFFLGSLKSVFIVCTSIPLSILTSICFLKLTGQTLNIMTLGGLSLAIGMLVDDATVEIENINRNTRLERTMTLAILRGASQVALPAIMSTLAICIVFSPIVLLTGAARYLFTPMAMAVVFAMLASYVFSRTLVPVLARMLLKKEDSAESGDDAAALVGRGSAWSSLTDIPHRVESEIDSAFQAVKRELSGEGARARRRANGWLASRAARFNKWRDKKFDGWRDNYESLLTLLMDQKAIFFTAFAVLVLASLALPMFLIGQDFFPRTDAGMMKLHFRARTGTRIEETEMIVARIEKEIQSIIPSGELRTLNSMIGMPFQYSLAFVPSDNIGAMDAEIQIALQKKHHSTEEYETKIRERLAEKFPGTTMYFQPAGLIDQVLGFGQTSVIDVQIEARAVDQGFDVATRLLKSVRGIPGAVDAHIAQVFDYPTLNLNVDRIRAARLGLSQKDVAAAMLISLSSSSLYAPSFYLNPENNVSYFVVTKVPFTKIATVDDLLRTPVSGSSGSSGGVASLSTLGLGGDRALDSESGASVSGMTQSASDGAPTSLLGSVAQVQTGMSLDRIDHTDVQRVVDITAGVQGRDLGGVIADIEKAIKDMGDLPAGVHARLLGQGQVMQEAFQRLALGIVIAIVLVYLLMVVLFQSWLDPFIILMTLPAALVGILWMLAITGTSINVESLMGSIMAIGIAVSNSILLVSFANDQRVQKGLNSVQAAVAAGRTRLRPVIMTALAMILGMLPMSLALSSGGEQNAPLARAVIGGLLVATLSTLFMVPVLYSVLRRKEPEKARIRREMDRYQDEFAKEQQRLSGAQHA